MVTRGPIEADATKGVESTMCTPIYPATEHPSGREPIRPTYVSLIGRRHPIDLPYDNCYFHSSDATFATVRVKRMFKYDWVRHITLEGVESQRRRWLVGEDHIREKALLAEIKLREEAERLKQEEDQEAPPGAVEGDEKPETLCAGGIKVVDSADVPNDTLDDIHNLVNFLMAESTPGDDVIPVTDLTYDIWKFPDFADAKDFHEESAQIRRYAASR